MKTTLGIIMATALASQAAVLQFDLSPDGTDVDVGLSPSNAVPAVTNSMGSGNELMGDGIFYDTDAGLLMLSIGYGSAGGFTNNLTGGVIAAHIHGPAPAGEASSNIVADLKEIHFVAATGATNGGVIMGGVMVETNKSQPLLDGLWYINLHTEANPDGEIRGQLIPGNVAPVIICSEDVTTECGDMTTTEIMVSDADGDEVVVYWMVNGVAMDPVTVPGDIALVGTNIVIEAEYPVGTNLLEFVAVDPLEMSSSCSTTVVVEDTIPPVIGRVNADPNTLWPPNHKMVVVNVTARIEDACGGVRWRIVDVKSNEPENDKGDGNTEPDWNLIRGNPHAVELRAERSGNLTGREYTIWVEAMDGAGNMAEPKTVTVTVPHDQGKESKKPKKSWWRR